MESQRVNDELLKLILTKLQRLERHFTDIDSRLSVIEFSIVPPPESLAPDVASSSAASRRCSCQIPQPVFQSFHVDWERHATASAYKASVDKLRNQFEFDDQSLFPSQDIGVASTCDVRSETGDVFVNNYDNYSISVYPSRPVSNFGFHINDMRPTLNSSELPSLRYEDMPVAEETLTSVSTSSRRHSVGFPIRTRSSRRRSASIARTSRVSSAPEVPPIPASFSKLRGSVRRARSLSVPRRKTPPADRDVAVANEKENAMLKSGQTQPAVIQEQDTERFVQFMQKGAKACIFFVPNMVSGLGKKMMNQQLRMLDVGA
ncbi:hypothetical protein CkaCkLH20_02317 [Colletotrichum karsti]|uniref:Uncharacterized protein n=1 Tax=Colletotrichum karsti TaxID=1095194 RepID=A0A9P6LNV9_9PEZI|nr:uncharacterized protein CkaCkLH20_02317 [Colletotrichum karsti]KAF9880363.1 hypothetical protein CkaCkLH20_02317 [Colletotrichum karsti]